MMSLNHAIILSNLYYNYYDDYDDDDDDDDECFDNYIIYALISLDIWWLFLKSKIRK
jgi:hypothetical protein